MQLKWYYVDDKDVAASNNEFVFRLKKDTENVTIRYKKEEVCIFRLQVRKKQNVTFYEIGYKFLLTKIYESNILEKYVDRIVWSEINDIVSRAEDILITLGYLEDDNSPINKEQTEDYVDNEEDLDFENEEKVPDYWTEEKIEKYLEIGKGKGEKGSYKSWLTTIDIPANYKEESESGSSNWIFDEIRFINLIGTLDIGFFNAMQWNRECVDIREYYPLERNRTLQIAKELKITHQKDKITRIPIVMVTNFLVTYEKDGIQYDEAIITSWSDKTTSKRFQNQLKIIKKYWEEKEVVVRLITEKDINWVAARNYSRLWNMKHANHYILNHEECEICVNTLKQHQIKCPTMTVSEFARTVSEDVSLTPGQIHCALEFLIANRVIEFPHTDIEFLYNLPINTFTIKHTNFKVEAVRRPPRMFEDKILSFI